MRHELVGASREVREAQKRLPSTAHSTCGISIHTSRACARLSIHSVCSSFSSSGSAPSSVGNFSRINHGRRSKGLPRRKLFRKQIFSF